MSGTEKVWLIRSGGRILGPFTHKDVEDRIGNREIIQVDEACKPGTRWRLIKDLKDFDSALSNLKNRRKSAGTQVTQTASAIRDETVTNTSTPAPENGSPSLAIRSKASSDEIVVDVVEEVSRKKSRGDTRDIKVFGTEKSLAGRVETQTSNRKLWIVTIAIGLVLVLGFITQVFVRGPGARTQQAKTLVDGAASFLKQGDYRAALAAYRQSYELSEKNSDLLLNLGILLVQLNEDVSLGRELLQKAKAGTEYPHLVLNGIGIAQMKEGENKKALEEFQNSLKLMPNFSDTYVNMGVANYRAGNFAKARADFEKAIALGTSENSVRLMLAQTLLQLAGEEGYPVSEAALKAQKMAAEVFNTGFDLGQEALFLKLYASSLLNKTDDISTDLPRLLDLHPSLTGFFVHSLFVDRELLSWRYYSQWCKTIADKSVDAPLGRMLESLCVYKAGSPEKASEIAEVAIQMDPQNPLIQANFAYLLEEQGQASAATVARGKAVSANRNGNYILPSILQAEFCEARKDSTCALTEWTSILSKSKNHPLALSGLTRTYLLQGDQDKASETFEQARRAFGDSFLPINRLYSTFASFYQDHK